MFSGIIQALLKLENIKKKESSLSLTFSGNHEFVENTQIGDSIAINGVCSTLCDKTNHLNFEYSPETLKKSNIGELKVGDYVNAEKSLTLQTLISGHLVSGHVDCCGILKEYQSFGDTYVAKIDYPPKFRPYLVEKGSVCIDGIGLTVVDLEAESFCCHIIEHTHLNTNFCKIKNKIKINIEFDLIGKYVLNKQMLEGRN